MLDNIESCDDGDASGPGFAGLRLRSGTWLAGYYCILIFSIRMNLPSRYKPLQSLSHIQFSG